MRGKVKERSEIDNKVGKRGKVKVREIIGR